VIQSIEGKNRTEKKTQHEKNEQKGKSIKSANTANTPSAIYEVYLSIYEHFVVLSP
jgi:hypothetical protein